MPKSNIQSTILDEEGPKLRVQDELNELQGKINAIISFEETDIWDSLSILKKKLLDKQLEIMQKYADILEQRIQHWND